MVILPLYRLIYATLSDKSSQTSYFAFLNQGKQIALDLSFKYPSYTSNNQQICGISTKEEQEFISLAPFQIRKSKDQLLFTLSKKKISFPVLSDDHQRIAFLEQELPSYPPILRVIQREEFGWFPLQIKKQAIKKIICFVSDNNILYTDSVGNLVASTTDKASRTILIAKKAHTPAYHFGTRQIAFVQDDSVVVYGRNEIKLSNVTALCFSKKGEALFAGVEDQGSFGIKSIDLVTRQITDICTTTERVVMVAEP